jgi:hypothetical protein
MGDQEQVALRTEIRDLHRQHVELTEQTLKNQAQMLAARQR